MDDLLHAARDLAYEVRAIVKRGLHLPNDVLIACERVELAVDAQEEEPGRVAVGPKARGVPLDTDGRETIAGAVRDCGEDATPRMLGVSRQTLARLLGGMPVYPGTLALVRERLARRS